MKSLMLLALVGLGASLVIAGGSAAAEKPETVTMQGQMVCLWCDVVLNALPEKSDETHKCAPAFRATDDKVYTLVPDKLGKELGSLEMHEQKVEVEAYVLPKTQIIEVYSYKIIEKVDPVTPEKEPWFNF